MIPGALGPALEHLFVATVGPTPLLLGTFLEVSGIGVDYEVHEYPEGGNNIFVHKLRGRMRQNDLTLKSGVTWPGVLLDWTLGTGLLSGPQNVYLAFLSPAGLPVRVFGFAAAVPVRWTGPDANIGANAVATESLVIAHQGLMTI